MLGTRRRFFQWLVGGAVVSTPPIPYVAPWATGFTRYSTQTLTFPINSSGDPELTVPDNTWYRILWAQGRYQTDGTVGVRGIDMRVTLPQNASVWFQQPLTPAASTTTFAMWGPSQSPFSVIVNANKQYTQTQIPDILWGPSNAFIIEGGGVLGASDAWLTPVVAGVEVYTEDYTSGALVPAVAPTPVLT